METASNRSALPVRVRLGYSLGSLATGAFGTVPGLLLLPYLTDTLGVAAGLAGLLVLLPKAWDVLLNPVVGRISDRTVTRIGARRPYLIGGGIALGVLFAAMFAGPFGTSAAAPIYVTVLFLLCASAYAVFQVPYIAMPAEMTDDHDRTHPADDLADRRTRGSDPGVRRSGTGDRGRRRRRSRRSPGDGRIHRRPGHRSAPSVRSSAPGPRRPATCFAANRRCARNWRWSPATGRSVRCSPVS